MLLVLHAAEKLFPLSRKFSALVAPTLALAQSSSDIVTKLDSTSVKGTLSQMTKTEVTIEKNRIIGYNIGSNAKTERN